MMVSQKDPELLYRMAEMWGGSVRYNQKGIYVWRITGARAAKFYTDIKPWLTARRIEQIEKRVVA